MKNIRIFLSENFLFLVETFSVYLNRLVFVMRGMSTRPLSCRYGGALKSITQVLHDDETVLLHRHYTLTSWPTSVIFAACSISICWSSLITIDTVVTSCCLPVWQPCLCYAYGLLVFISRELINCFNSVSQYDVLLNIITASFCKGLYAILMT